MRSLFARILLWFLATIAVAVIGMVITAAVTSSAPRSRQYPLGILVHFELREARRAYHFGGKEGLAEALERFHEGTQMTGYLTDSQGRNLLTGEDHSDLLRMAEARPGYPFLTKQRITIGRPSQDGRYWYFLMIPRTRWFLWFLQPQYVWILGVVVLLSYLLARNLTSPLRQLQRAVEHFGRGNLAARAGSDRGDELGELARTFDRMADRTQTLLEAERRLLMDISHELRSPLARLNLAVELARSGDDADAALNRIQKEADRLNTLIGELLQVTRAEGDSSRLRSEEVRLDRLLHALAEDGALEAAAKGCEVRLRADRQIAVWGDEELLRRAFENVLRNAVRYAPAGTAVEVTLEEMGSRVKARVRDFGPGVPEECLLRIFDAFYRVEKDRDRASGGSGLGLAIARRAVQLHQGEIRAWNRHPGLEVVITLPAGATDDENAGGVKALLAAAGR